MAGDINYMEQSSEYLIYTMVQFHYRTHDFLYENEKKNCVKSSRTSKL